MPVNYEQIRGAAIARIGNVLDTKAILEAKVTIDKHSDLRSGDYVKEGSNTKVYINVISNKKNGAKLHNLIDMVSRRQNMDASARSKGFLGIGSRKDQPFKATKAQNILAGELAKAIINQLSLHIYVGDGDAGDPANGMQNAKGGAIKSLTEYFERKLRNYRLEGKDHTQQLTEMLNKFAGQELYQAIEQGFMGSLMVMPANKNMLIFPKNGQDDLVAAAKGAAAAAPPQKPVAAGGSDKPHAGGGAAAAPPQKPMAAGGFAHMAEVELTTFSKKGEPAAAAGQEKSHEGSRPKQRK